MTDNKSHQRDIKHKQIMEESAKSQEQLLQEIKKLLSAQTKSQNALEKRLEEIEVNTSATSSYVHGDVEVTNFPKQKDIEINIPEPPRQLKPESGRLVRNANGTVKEVIDQLNDGSAIHTRFFYDANGEMTGYKFERRS